MTNSHSTMTKDVSSCTVIAFSGFATPSMKAPRRPKWFRNRSREEHKKNINDDKHAERSMLESTKHDSNSTIDLLQDELDNLKILAVRIATSDQIEDQDEDSLDHSSLSLARGDLVDCLDKDDSFDDTEATETVTSESEGNDDENGSFLDCEEASVRSVRFADEAGLPMEHVVHIQPPAQEELEAEVVVLCLSPQHKKFEFVHVGYHRCTENDDRSMGNKPTLVSDLLAHLPQFCTNELFQKASFDKIFRTNKSNGMLEKLLGGTSSNGVDEPSMPLQDCNLDKSDILVATVTGCSDEEALSSVDSLLSNSRLMKTMRRARRTQRGLKWIPAKYTESSSPSSLASHMIARTSETVKDYVGLFLGDDDEIEVLTEDEQRAKAEQDRFERDLVQGVVMVTGLTVIFSLMGI